MTKCRTLIMLAICLCASLTMFGQDKPVYICTKGTILTVADTKVPESARQACRAEYQAKVESESNLIHRTVEFLISVRGLEATPEQNNKTMASACAMRTYFVANGKDEPGCLGFPPDYEVLKGSQEICRILRAIEDKPVYCERLMPLSMAPKTVPATSSKK